MAEPTTVMTVQIAALQVMLTSILGELIDPDGKRPADEANAKLKQLEADALTALTTAKVDASEFSGSEADVRREVEREIRGFFSSIKFRD